MMVFALFNSMQFETSVGTEWVDTIIGIYSKYEDACWDADRMTERNARSSLKGVYFVRGFDIREERQL